MPEVDDEVMGFVEEVLNEEPEIRLEELFERTKEFRPSVAKLSKRQFNGRYPLQVKRRRALAERKAGGRGSRKTPAPRTAPAAKAPPGASRDHVRRVLLGFATDISAAEERKDLVKVLADVDRYVDRVMEGVTEG